MAKWLEHQLVFITQLRFTKMKIKNKVHIIVIKIQFQKKLEQSQGYF